MSFGPLATYYALHSSHGACVRTLIWYYLGALRGRWPLSVPRGKRLAAVAGEPLILPE